jgi:pyrroline-5-carboxylate reductase
MSPTEERLHTALDALHSRDDFVRFVELLVESFNEAGPPWENATMRSFLLALAHAAKNLETYYDSPDEAAQNVASPNGEAIAGLLFSARCARVPKQGIDTAGA